MRALYTITLFVSSFLLFLVQPLAAKLILPTFGGAPAVWNASLVFFQTALLLGYGYAHFSTKKLGRKQPFLHLPLMALAGLALPFTLNTPIWKWVEGQASVGYANPSLLVIAALAGLVGIPFFIVSAGAPLIQRWFSETNDPSAKDPYFLYGASNLGSMLGLFAYPFFFEPRYRLIDQSQIWAAVFGVMVLGMLGCAAMMLRSPATVTEAQAATEETALTWKQRAFWVLLAAIPSSLLTGVSQFVTTNVAPIPLLWVVPLALYLFTFNLAFTNKRFVSTHGLSRAAPLLICPLFVMLVLDEHQPVSALIHLAAFFVAAWMCHSRLYDERPGTKFLTEFYVWVSVGGLVGGAFNGLLAPSIFNNLWEYPLALLAVAAVKVPYKEGKYAEQFDFIWITAVGVVTLVAILIAKQLNLQFGPTRTVLTLALPVVLCFVASDRPFRLAGSLGVFFAVSILAGSVSSGKTLVQDRSFFGVHRVSQSSTSRYYVHGNTLHGKQNLVGSKTPLTYYHPTGPIGQVFKNFSGPTRKDNVALVGLGVGSLASYGEAGQNMTFFEIDPKVVEIATNPKLFTYVSESKAKIDYVLGDARLTLAKQPDGKYGIIVLDAFSSDAIPVHLLTREAFAMYFKKLTPDGVLAVHVSNRYLDLEPVVGQNAKELGFLAWSQVDGITKDEELEGKSSSNWMLVARKKSHLGKMAGRLSWWSEVDTFAGTKAWTDDYSNVLSVFRSDN